jgi:hypothetical protein
MAAGERGTITTKCKNCGAAHRVSYVDYPVRDSGQFRCRAGCGAILLAWNGTRDYHDAELVEPEPSISH